LIVYELGLDGEIKTFRRHMDINQMLSAPNKLHRFEENPLSPSGYSQNETSHRYGMLFAIVFPKAYRLLGKKRHSKQWQQRLMGSGAENSAGIPPKILSSGRSYVLLGETAATLPWPVQ
jgi:hypothetical protein